MDGVFRRWRCAGGLGDFGRRDTVERGDAAARTILDSGFRDGYHDNRTQDGETAVSRWGYTWTSNWAGDADDDRIDFVHYQGAGVSVLDSLLVGEANGNGYGSSTDVDLPVWQVGGGLQTVSDHRAVAVSFTLSGEPVCVDFADLNGDCTLDEADWALFKAGQQWDMSGLSLVEAYGFGDLNGDLANDHADFVLFKNAFTAANGAGSFTAMLTGVPEPSTMSLCVFAIAMLSTPVRNRVRRRQADADTNG